VPFARTVCTLPSGQRLDSEHALGKAEADAGILGVRLPQLEIEAWNSMSHGALLPRSGRSAWVKSELTWTHTPYAAITAGPDLAVMSSYDDLKSM